MRESFREWLLSSSSHLCHHKSMVKCAFLCHHRSMEVLLWKFILLFSFLPPPLHTKTERGLICCFDVAILGLSSGLFGLKTGLVGVKRSDASKSSELFVACWIESRLWKRRYSVVCCTSLLWVFQVPIFCLVIIPFPEGFPLTSKQHIYFALFGAASTDLFRLMDLNYVPQDGHPPWCAFGKRAHEVELF